MQKLTNICICVTLFVSCENEHILVELLRRYVTTVCLMLMVLQSSPGAGEERPALVIVMHQTASFQTSRLSVMVQY